MTGKRTVAVAADDELVAVLVGVAKAGLHSAADAEVERQPHHVGAVRGRDLRGAIGRAVGDHNHVEPRVEGMQLVDDAADVVLLVVGRDDRDPAERFSRHGLSP